MQGEDGTRNRLRKRATCAGPRDYGRMQSKCTHRPGVDLLLAWRIDVHQSMLFGYSHFWDSHFIKQTGASDDPDLFYVQYAFKF